MNMLLTDLSIEILLHIFQFCEIQELCRLKCTCQHFNKIIESSLPFILRSGRSGPLVTNQLHPFIRERSAVILSVHDKWRVSHYWKIGKYTEKSLLYERQNFIPSLQLTKDHVWISRGHYVKAFRRIKNQIDVRCPVYILSGNSPADVVKFAKTKEYIVSAQCNGNVWVWSPTENKIIHSQLCHNSIINSVDAHNNLFVTGSRDRSMKLWSSKDNYATSDCVYQYFLNDRVWSTSFDCNGLNLSVGTAGYNSVPPLHIFDLHDLRRKSMLGVRLPEGSGILDMKWEDNNILLTCGYDFCVRKWDLRTEKCEQAWKDPFHSTVYCLETDGLYTLLTGTQSNGRVVLFDTRQIEYIQMYFMQTCKKRGRSSPVYSLSNDATQLFAATDQHLNILDFTDKDAKVRNYGNIYYKNY